MIKVGFINIQNSGHAGRGIGTYASNLLKDLYKYQDEFQVQITEISTDDPNFNSFDLIHYPYFDLFFHSLPILHTPKFVVTCHDVIPLEFSNHYPPGVRGAANLLLQKLALKNVSAVITDSYASVKAIRKYLSVDHSRIKMIYLGPVKEVHKITDPKKLSLVKEKFNLPDKFILNVGDINWNKNIPGLIEACEKVNLPLVIIGKGAVTVDKLDPGHPELKHIGLLQEKFKSPKILRLGFVSDSEFAAVASMAILYCQPSFAEGFGFSVLHAMACGAPVVCSRSHSLPEICGPAAVYFDPQNPDEIVAAMKKVLTNASLRSDLIKKGFAQAGNFSWDTAAIATLNVYKSIISRT